MRFTDEDLRNGHASVRPLDHLGPALSGQRDVDFVEGDALRRQQRFCACAVRTQELRVDGDLRQDALFAARILPHLIMRDAG